MKHSPCQASLHKGNFTLMKNTHKFQGDAATQTNSEVFKSMHNMQTMLILVGILSREDLKLLLGIYFQRVNVERNAHEHRTCGTYALRLRS